ncbi:MAG: hypothetical protein AAFO06_16475, partial [Cyanobacteria bacterium J06597_16]
MPINQGNLTKATLVSIKKSEADDIIFMFNPKDLSFSTSVKTADNPGARSEKTGRPKVSFSDIPPKKIEIKDIWFDTYETGQDVKKQYLQGFISAVTFSKDKERPPLYRFMWKEIYFESCFIEQLNYRLTKFLPDGTPVRAVIETLGLKETEDPAKDAAKQKKSQPDAKND